MLMRVIDESYEDFKGILAVVNFNWSAPRKQSDKCHVWLTRAIPFLN